MKNKFLAVLCLCAVFIFSCPDSSSVFDNNHNIPKGMGSVTISFSGVSRTVLPKTPELSDFKEFEFFFTAVSGGENEKEILPYGSTYRINLLPGTYSLAVNAYDSNGVKAAASSAQSVTVKEGTNNTVTVTLKALSGEGEGTLSWDINFDMGTSGITVTNAWMNITKDGISQGPDVYIAGTSLGETAEPQGSRDFSYGLYLLKISIFGEDASVPPMQKNVVWYESAYIYGGLTSICKITFTETHLNGAHHNVLIDENYTGSSEPYYNSVEHGGVLSSPYVPDRDDFVFGGWYRDKACTEGYEWNFNNRIHQSMTLYAKWIPYPNTEDNPFLIETKEELAKVGSGEDVKGTGPWTLDAFYLLMNNISLSGNWTPIGNFEETSPDKPFTGNFNGNGFTISGINIDNNYNEQGLFGYIGTNGVVKNLYVTGSIKANENVGGIAGYNKGTIQNCSFSGTVTGNENVGGIAGLNNNGGTITNCYNTGEITGNTYTGGIAGYNENSNISNCYNTGIIKNDGGIGGIVGGNKGTVKNCVSLGPSVIGTSNLGRVIGSRELATSTDTNNYARSQMNVGTSVVTDGTAANINGKDITSKQWNDKNWWRNTAFTGISVEEWVWWDSRLPPEIAPDGKADNPFLVNNLTDLLQVGRNGGTGTYAGWTLSAHYRQTDNITLTDEWTTIGGDTNGNRFIGSYDGDGYNINDLLIDNNSNNQGLFAAIGDGGKVKNLGLVDVDITASSYVGGIAGNNYGTILNCFVTGTITGKGSSIGGISGHNSSGGLIEYCYSTVVIIGPSFAGGIGGALYEDGRISNCVSLNPSITREDSYDNSDFGRVVGSTNGTLSNNFVRNDMQFYDGTSLQEYFPSFTAGEDKKDGVATFENDWSGKNWWKSYAFKGITDEDWAIWEPRLPPIVPPVTGVSSTVTLTVGSETPVEKADLKTALDDIPLTGGTYTVTLLADQQLMSYTFKNYTSSTTINIVGGTSEKKVNLSGLGALFVVGGNNLTVSIGNNITLIGNSSNSYPVVGIINNGNFTMTGSSKITGNKSSAHGGGVYMNTGTFTMTGGNITDNETAGDGGGVYVDAGTFAMNGGVITKNKALNGGGVDNSGVFTMTNGTITENEVVLDGGGVYLTKGTFTMSGNSEISNNKAGDWGGGVCVRLGTFTMQGGTISGNSAINYGGGVFVNAMVAYFIKNDGGIIYGYSSTDSNSNVVKNNTGNVINGNGHSLYIQNHANIPHTRNLARDTTVNASENLDY